MKVLSLASIGMFLLSACETARATSAVTPKERVVECEKICTDVGMKLGALVVMMSHAGCVCEPKDTPASSERKAAAAAAGGAIIAAAAAAAQASALAAQQSARPVYIPPSPVHR